MPMKKIPTHEEHVKPRPVCFNVTIPGCRRPRTRYQLNRKNRSRSQIIRSWPDESESIVGGDSGGSKRLLVEASSSSRVQSISRQKSENVKHPGSLKIRDSPEVPENKELRWNLRSRGSHEVPENKELRWNLRHRRSREVPENNELPQNSTSRECREVPEIKELSWYSKSRRSRRVPQNKEPSWALRSREPSESFPEKTKFSVALSKEELKDDVSLVNRVIPRRRPKNRLMSNVRRRFFLR